MEFIFDHLVHFVDDPEAAITILRENGIHAVEGGVHINRGTYNALSYFDLSYIEYLGIYDRDLVEQREHLKYSLIETIIQNNFTDGFTRFAIRTTDINKAALDFREKGLTVNGPVSLNRKRPDGKIIHWQLLYIGDENENLHLPFIIQWNESDENRLIDLKKSGAIPPNQYYTFSHVSFAVRDLKQIVNKWSKWFNLQVGTEYIDKNLNARCQILQLLGGNLVFCSPLGYGTVLDILNTHGERPFKVTLSGENIDRSFELFGETYQLIKSNNNLL